MCYNKVEFLQNRLHYRNQIFRACDNGVCTILATIFKKVFTQFKVANILNGLCRVLQTPVIKLKYLKMYSYLKMSS